MKPTIVQGDGITLVLGACSHDNEQTTVGPTTDQINHWCPDCRRHWTTWPDRTCGVMASENTQEKNHG